MRFAADVFGSGVFDARQRRGARSGSGARQCDGMAAAKNAAQSAVVDGIGRCDLEFLVCAMGAKSRARCGDAVGHELARENGARRRVVVRHASDETRRIGNVILSIRCRRAFSSGAFRRENRAARNRVARFTSQVAAARVAIKRVAIKRVTIVASVVAASVVAARDFGRKIEDRIRQQIEDRVLDLGEKRVARRVSPSCDAKWNREFETRKPDAHDIGFSRPVDKTAGEFTD